MERKKDNLVKELNIERLFSKDKYVIPIYQRNYAWEEEQIIQLIQDIFDSSQNQSDKPYYIGSLVAFKRGNGTFEVIDGQQRHTTLSILLAVLKNKFKSNKENKKEQEWIKPTNLSYDSRSASQKTLEGIFKKTIEEVEDLEDSEGSIIVAYKIIQKQLNNIDKDLDKFSNYLKEKVIILRVLVPETTDLNHYFEVMNNRGEQLEKHEVLKARLMSELNKEEPEELEAFSAIWDACADMDRYIQYGFSPKLREKVFGKDLNNIPKTFDAIKDLSVKEEGLSEESSIGIFEYLGDDTIDDKEVDKDSKGDEDTQRFHSVINFPNFLLQVLKVYHSVSEKVNINNSPISLDDKKLLEEFNIISNDEKKIKEFSLALLQMRFLFDKYVIKRELGKKWSLKRMKNYESGNINYVNTFSKSDQEEESSDMEEIIMIQSMLHVSNPSMIYKNWLTGILDYLYKTKDENQDTKTEENNLDSKNVVKFLQEYSDSLFFSQLEEKSNNLSADLNDKDSALKKLLNKGINVPNYFFNRLDYLIWKANKCNQIEEYLGELNLKKEEIKEKIKSFEFTFRSSVEHYYPQNPIGDNIMNSELLNGFGNLCLISKSKNSKLSNHTLKAKIDYYSKSEKAESLKQSIMMGYDSEKWHPSNTSGLKEHENLMFKLIQMKVSELEGLVEERNKEDDICI